MSQRLLRHLAGALTLLLTLAGCDLKLLPGGGLPNTGVPQDGISQTIPLIEGELVDAAGQPVEGATVRAYVAPYRIEAVSHDPVSATETTTDAHGAFKLVSPSLGSVAIEARGKGQKALRTGVSVKSGTQVELGTLALQPTGRIAGRVTAASGASLLGTDVFIPGTDYLAKTAADGAYMIQDVPVGTYQLAAVRPNFQPRVLEGIQVTAGQTITAPDLELSLDAPVLTSVNPTSGGPGAVVTLHGANFGESKHTMLQVTFGDTLATTAKRLSDTEIEATVPLGASGGVIVRSNGIASTLKAFTVITSLTLSPASVMMYPGATSSLSIRALNEEGGLVPDPFVAWALRNPAIGIVGALGTFQALGTGVTELTVHSGLPAALSWVGVSPCRATTLYGTGRDTRAGDGGPARQASFNTPYALARDAAGNLYVAEQSTTVIRRIGLDGIIERFAGNGTMDWSGDGGPALEAGLGTFTAITVDQFNRLWLSDTEHHVIRFIPLDERSAPTYRAGYIYRAVGTGTAGYSPDGAVGSSASVNNPRRMEPGPDGLYFADHDNHRIRRIDAEFRVTDVLGTGIFLQLSAPMSQAAAPVCYPNEVALDERGNMLIATNYQLLYWCRETGEHLGRSMTAGMVYPIANVDPARTFHGDSEGLAETMPSVARGLAPDGHGGFWIVQGMLVRHLTPSGRLETIGGKAMEQANFKAFGPDGEGMNALCFSLANPSDLLLLGDRLLVVDSTYCRIVQLEPLAP